MIDIKVFTFDTKELAKSKRGLQSLLKKGYKVKDTLVVNGVVIYTLSINADDIRDYLIKHVPMGAERTKVKKILVDCAIKSYQAYNNDICDERKHNEMSRDVRLAFGSKNEYWVKGILSAISDKDKIYGKNKPVEEYYPILAFLGFDIEEEKQ